MKKGKGNYTAKSKKIKTDWVKEAFRNWALAVEKNDNDPLRLKDAPEWVFNAYVECAKIVIPGGLPPAERWNAEYLGVFLGRFVALEKLFAGEVLLGPETQGDLEKLKTVAAKQPLPENFKAFQKEVEPRFKATHEVIPLVTAMAGNASYGEMLDFQRGYMRGIEIKPEELATSRVFRRHTRTFWVLALYWPYWVKCKSVREIYQHLCNAIGERKIGTFKTFETHVVRKIGLKIRSPGRPKAAK